MQTNKKTHVFTYEETSVKELSQFIRLHYPLKGKF